ncbi:MAG TPA: hypothetical protein DIV86_03290 [Alphaproteobacteria bacterium]|nr:hypothetical protein [Alphaproteobacteria bacterium]
MERNFQLDWQEIVTEAINRRKQQKLNQKQLAVIAGISHPTIIKFENCDPSLKLESAFAILKVLGLVK